MDAMSAASGAASAVDIVARRTPWETVGIVSAPSVGRARLPGPSWTVGACAAPRWGPCACPGRGRH
eukprot:10156209-Alexandrium_andersonii.AAC.1